MARLNVIICDLCKSLSKSDLPYILSLQSGKGKDKEVTKAEICKKCYESMVEDIDSEFDFNNMSLPNTRKPQAAKIEVAAGETIVPSNLGNIAPLPAKPTCLHDRKSIDDRIITCRDCGEKWNAELS